MNHNQFLQSDSHDSADSNSSDPSTPLRGTSKPTRRMRNHNQNHSDGDDERLGSNILTPPRSRTTLKYWGITSSSFFNQILSLRPSTSSQNLMIIGAVTFVGDCSRGILFPVLWGLCQKLGGSLLDLGFLVASFSLGRLLVTTPFGYFCDRYRHRLTLIVANSILLFGSLIWANAYKFRTLASLYVAQFIMGCGSGSLGVTRSFVSEQCPPQQRTEMLAIVTALQYAGFTISPALGSALASISPNTYWEYSLPAYVITLFCTYIIIALMNHFEDLQVNEDCSRMDVLISAERSSKEELSYLENCKDLEVAVFNPLVTGNNNNNNNNNHVGTMVDSPIEGTSAEGLEEKTYDKDGTSGGNSAACQPTALSLSSSSTTVAASATMSVTAAITGTTENKREVMKVLIIFILLNISTKGTIAVYETLGAQLGTDYGFSKIFMGNLVTIAGSIGFLQLIFFKYWVKYFSDLELMLGGMAIMIVAQLIVFPFNGVEASKYQFLICIFLMYSFGYPIGHTAVLGAFSKVQKRGPQAALLGWFATAGSFSRIALPIIVSWCDTLKDNSPFSIVIIILTASIMGVLAYKGPLTFYANGASIGESSMQSVSSPLRRRQASSNFIDKVFFIIVFSVFLFALSQLILDPNAAAGSFDVDIMTKEEDVGPE